MGTLSTQTQSETLNWGIDFEGSFNDNWDWEAGFGVSSENTDSERLNTLDNSALAPV